MMFRGFQPTRKAPFFITKLCATPGAIMIREKAFGYILLVLLAQSFNLLHYLA
jgi:hypothetical protein